MISSLRLTPGKKTKTGIVWLLRLLVGATFVMSGLTKCIDLWGVVYKIEEYFIVWSIDLPLSLYVMTALALSVSEFLLGLMLLIGSYRRSVPWLLLLVMTFMLPLSFYIFIANPVADCGCFGDFLTISNGATFLKNIFLTVAIVLLIMWNRQVACLFNPYIQWVPAVAAAVYILAVGMFGYNIQPLVDFRSFPVGTRLAVSDVDMDDSEDAGSEPQFEFIYEKDGHQASFGESDLPDSTWTFVDRKLVAGSVDERTELVVYDGDSEVTEDVIMADEPQLLIVIPDRRRVNISYTYAINELQHCMDSIGGSMIEIAAMPESEINGWRDLSMATYPIYRAEPTVLKELARGVVAAVYVEDGKIMWKRSLPSIDVDRIAMSENQQELLRNLSFSGGHLLAVASLILFAFYCLVYMLEKSRYLAVWMSKMRPNARQSEKK